MTSLLAWHGTRADGTTKHLKIKEVVGVKTLLAGDVELCKNALHGSLRAVDMLRFSEGLWIKRTLHEGTIIHDSDKFGSSERTVVAEADATKLIVDWAFWCADRAVRIHAVAALRQAGMNIEAEKLASLKVITDKKSAFAAANAADGTDAANAASSAANAASSAASNTAVCAVNAAAASSAASNTACAAAYAVVDAVDAVDNAASTASNTACAAADANEMDFLNAELERRLLALMGLTETEVIQ